MIEQRQIRPAEALALAAAAGSASRARPVLALSGRIVQHALAAGLPQDIVDGIAAGGTAALPHPFGLLREVFDQDSCLAADPEALQAQAATKWGTDGLVEIVMVSGFYQMFAAINQGFDISSLTAAANAAEHKP